MFGKPSGQPFPNTVYRVSIKALILDDQNRFLLAKEANGYWDLLGGGLDFNEDPRDCLAREIKEEAGLTLSSIASNPSYFFTFIHTNKRWSSNVLYQATLKDHNFIPSDECQEFRFFTPKEALKENLFPSAKKFVELFSKDN